MASSIRLTTSGTPDIPPAGYARIFVEEFEGKIYLKMIRPDGSIEVFGTLNSPLDITQGGTGVTSFPEIGQFLIGTSTGYRIGDITPGNGINIVKSDTEFEISATLSNLDLVMPEELDVEKTEIDSQTTLTVTKKSQSKNLIYASPVDEDGIPSFRFIQLEDLPDIPISKIIDLIETIRAESLLIPVNSDDINHEYDSVAKTLTSTLKATNVTAGQYGAVTKTLQISVKADGRLDELSESVIAIPSTQITDFNEAVQNQVGILIVDSISINAEYNDYENTLKLHVNEETLITTNISENENVRAPTSQSIKQYVDDLIDAERTARINQDTSLQSSITALETQVGDNLQQALDDINTAIAEEISERIAADNALDERLDIVQGTGEGSITKAKLDAQSYADNITIAEKNRAESAESALDARLDIVQGSGQGSIVKAQLDAQSYTDNAVLVEKNRAENIENQLQTQIDNVVEDLAQEVLDRTAAVLNEKDRAIAVEIGFHNRLNTIEGIGPGSIVKAETDAKSYADGIVLTEKTRAELAENNLDDKITNVVNNLTLEITNRTTADNTLQQNINNETTARLASESTLLNSAKSYTDTKVANLVNSAPQVLDTLKELSDALGGDENFAATVAGQIGTIETNLTNEINTRTSQDTILQNNINAEKTRAETAELQLTTDLNTERNERLAKDNELKGDIDQEVEDRIDAIAQEVIDRNAAIQTAVTQSIIPRTDVTYDLGSPQFRFKDLYLSGNSIILGDATISSNQGIVDLPEDATVNNVPIATTEYVDQEITTERNARIAQDGILQDNIDTEEQSRINADDILQDNIDAEELSRINADNTLQDNIDNERDARIDADTLLDGRLDIIEGLDTVEGSIKKALKDAKAYTDQQVGIEEDARISADNNLQEQIDDEITARENADFVLDGKITNETTARQTAVTTINGRLDVLQGDVNTVGSVAKAESDAKTYADTKIANLVNSAPEVLNTLKELADALGNDANFATTISEQFGIITNSITTEINDRQTADALLIPLSQKGTNSGVATLDSEGKIPASQLRINDVVVNSTSGSETDKAPSVNAIKSYVNDVVTSEANIRQTQDNALIQKLNVIEGTGPGSIIKAEIDAKTYADSKISELVNGAPDLLNTLNELAAAIGNDQSFITTINSSINSLQTSISGEITNRQVADTQINSTISALENSLTSDINTKFTSLQNNLTTEQNNRISADNALQSAITLLQTQISSDTQARLDELTTDLGNETNTRIAADQQINQRLDTFFANSSENLNTLSEIEQRFELFETGSASTAGQLAAFRTEVNTKINVDLANIQALIGIEADARVAEINRISNNISAKRERFDLTPSMINGPIELLHVQNISKIMPNSIVAFIDRLGIFEELDFNLQNTIDNKVILTFTPEILTILDGTEVLRMTYLKKE